MNEQWQRAVITEISVAVYVAPNTGRHIHKDRPFHGFVINDSCAVKDYCFDDGFVMRTEGNSLFYLPKGSSYHVEQIKNGGCYAINFDSNISDAPFCISLRNANQLVHNFKEATDAWKSNDQLRIGLAMRTVYDVICKVQKELQKQYLPQKQRLIIDPAVDEINQRFADKNLSISHLASLCGVSEVYLRRLFLNFIGISPKEYIIQKRLEYAKQLLLSGQFNVCDVAKLCGYKEECHFSREFKKRFLVSPCELK